MRRYSYFAQSLKPKEAAAYLLIAAEDGNTLAQVELASILLNHKGYALTEQMFQNTYGGLEDQQLTKNGAKLDDGEALAKLRAAYWLRMAYANGNLQAKAKLAELGE